MELFKIKDLTFTYALSNKPSLENVSLEIEEGSFVLLCGPTGCGKTTLLKNLKREIAPAGEAKGEILYRGKRLSDLPDRISSSEIGFLSQHPEEQTVTDKVWHELAFTLENLAYPQEKIARRIAEVSQFLGIEGLFERKTSELSGGELQLVALASVLAADPKVLILDEPISKLDPVAAYEFTSALKRIRDELSVTVVISEHRIDSFLPLCDRIFYMENGKIASCGAPENVILSLCNDRRKEKFVPAYAKLFALTGGAGKCPLSVGEGKKYLHEFFLPSQSDYSAGSFKNEKTVPAEFALEMNNITFRYDRQAKDVLSELSLSVNKGEIFCIFGGNGSGKTTALGVACGLLKAYEGAVKIFGRKLSSYKNGSLYQNCLAYLPQDVTELFLFDRVEKELREALAAGVEPLLNFEEYKDTHPYDLSGGEMQLLALTKVLASKPKLLLMDEPTRGLDPVHRAHLTDVIKSLKNDGVTVVFVTHDVEFAAETADRAALFFRGKAVCLERTDLFFENNRFYTTASAKLSEGFYPGAVTEETLLSYCLENVREQGEARHE